MTDTLVSVIIDNYNYGRFLRQAVESALSQSYEKIEVIVVDDGSTDDSRSIISDYGRNVVAVFKENGGQASAMNAGFQMTSGEVVVILDSDDWLFPEAVEQLLDYFSDPHVSKVHWPLRVVDEGGNFTGELKPSTNLPDGELREKVLKGGPTSSLSSPTSGNAWARSFLNKVMPIPESVEYYKKCADEYLYTLAPVFGLIRRADTPLGCYRIHGKNIYSSLSFDERLRCEIDGHSQQCEVLTLTLMRNGFEPEMDRWIRNSWFHRLKRALEVLLCIAAEQKILLVDDCTWGLSGEYRDVRISLFPTMSGEYCGPPESDKTAAESLLSEIEEGDADYFVLAWPAFWWVEEYPGFFNKLRYRFPLVIDNEELKIFDLRGRGVKTC